MTVHGNVRRVRWNRTCWHRCSQLPVWTRRSDCCNAWTSGGDSPSWDSVCCVIAASWSALNAPEGNGLTFARDRWTVAARRQWTGIRPRTVLHKSVVDRSIVRNWTGHRESLPTLGDHIGHGHHHRHAEGDGDPEPLVWRRGNGAPGRYEPFSVQSFLDSLRSSGAIPRLNDRLFSGRCLCLPCPGPDAPLRIGGRISTMEPRSLPFIDSADWVGAGPVR